MTNPLELSLINGPIPIAIIGSGAVAMLFLGVDRRRAWWTRVLPITVASCLLVTIGIGLFVNKVWRPFPDALPETILLWIGVALLGVALAVARSIPKRWWIRAASVLAAMLVLATAFTGVNRFYGQYPTVRAALGLLVAETTDLDDAAPPVAYEVNVPPGKKLVDVWQPPADLPTEGTVSEANIPGGNGYRGRNAWIYLPPAYAATPRPRLPVIVLLAGQPGTPREWFDPGQLAKHMDAFAREHKGLAPIVVSPDHLGALWANPLCLDSNLGQFETYLARDVPRWIKERLQVDENPDAWTIAGFSQGGTCAVQLAVRAPEVYRRFIDISGQREPTLGTRKETVRAAFGGDDAAFSRVNPLEILATKRFPNTAGVVVAGANDPEYRPQGREVFEACQKAGMDVVWTELPGGHDWGVWRPGLYQSLPWLATRVGLAR